MLNGAALTAAVANAPRSPFRGLTYRAIHLRFFPTLAACQPLFTAAGGLVGSRYVAPGGPESLYVALAADAAFREFNQDFLALAATPLGAQQVVDGLLRPPPLVTLGIHIDVAHVLDLTRGGVRRQLGTALPELTGRWRNVLNAPTQVLGAVVFASTRFQGILYPSAQHPSRDCLVVFRPRLAASPPASVDFRDGPCHLAAQLP